MAAPFSQSFQFDELDATSRQYLLKVREDEGRGMPGLYVPQSSSMAGWGCFGGIVVLIAFYFICDNVITESPLAVALLETAGLLLGGWLIIAALRLWISAKGTHHIGHFIYADAQTLWECSGYYVATTSLEHVVDASGVQNFNEGKFQNTAITLRTAEGRREFKVNNMEHGRQLVVFLNMLHYFRSGTEEQTSAAAPPETNQRMPANLIGGLARYMAVHGEVPAEVSPAGLGLQVEEMPQPQKEGYGSSSVLGYLLIIVVAIGSVFLFKQLNVAWRDDAIWHHINELRVEDRRVPLLRGYLADERNTLHRDAAKKMLIKIYDDNIARMRNANLGVGAIGVNAPIRVDDQLFEGFAEVLRAIAQQPQGVISVSVKETAGAGEPARAALREDEIRSKFTLKLFEGLGKDLAFYVRPPEDVPALIEVSYTLARSNGPAANQFDVLFTVKFRKKPDEEPVKTATLKVPVTNESTPEISKAAEVLGLRTAGLQKVEPPTGDF